MAFETGRPTMSLKPTHTKYEARTYTLLQRKCGSYSPINLEKK